MGNSTIYLGKTSAEGPKKWEKVQEKSRLKAPGNGKSPKFTHKKSSPESQKKGKLKEFFPGKKIPSVSPKKQKIPTFSWEKSALLSPKKRQKLHNFLSAASTKKPLPQTPKKEKTPHFSPHFPWILFPGFSPHFPWGFSTFSS